MVCPVFQTDLSKSLSSKSRDLSTIGVDQRQLDVLERRCFREQVKRLKDEPDPGVAKFSQFVGGQSRDVGAVQFEGARIGTVEQTDHVHQGRLPGPRWTGDGDEASVLDLQRDSVERPESLDAILGEQDLADSGRVSAPSAAKKGKILGAQLGVKLVVNAYDPDVKGKKGGLGGIGRMFGNKAGAAAGGINWSKAESRIGITVQLVNLETSQMLDSKQVDVRLKSRSIGFGANLWGTSGALGGFMSSYSQTPIGQAMIAATNIGVYHLIKGIGAEPPEGVVADVSDGKVMVTMGQGQVQSGDVIRAVGLGKEILHPETGLVLSRSEEELGQLRITDVQDGFSFAAPVEGTDVGKLKAGDKVVSTRTPEPYEFGAPWVLKKK